MASTMSSAAAAATATAANTPTIAIIGGGIAGLTLAIALHKRNIPITIYEKAHKFGEIGAGVGFTANAIDSMKICDEGIYNAFEQVVTRNLWKDKACVYFDFLDGTDQHTVGHQDAVFQLEDRAGMNGVHRARFLDAMIHLLPEDIAHFHKHLDNITELDTGRYQLHFRDGTTAEANAVIGCDGIHSATRQVIIDKNSPMANPVYTHKYAYRGLIDMDKALEAIGEERASNACLWMGPGRHILTFPIDHGETLNLVAFVTDDKDWVDYNRSTLPAHRWQMKRDFEGWGPNCKKLIEMCRPELDVWSIFDLGDHPLSTYNKGRMCVSGDAAHATTPHHGAGAGLCIEDSAIMATLLSHPSVTASLESVKNGSDQAELHTVLQKAFAIFTKVRKDRTQWLVADSRRCADIYEWMDKEIGQNYNKMHQVLSRSTSQIDTVDVFKLCENASDEMSKSTGIEALRTEK